MHILFKLQILVLNNLLIKLLNYTFEKFKKTESRIFSGIPAGNFKTAGFSGISGNSRTGILDGPGSTSLLHLSFNVATIKLLDFIH